MARNIDVSVGSSRRSFLLGSALFAGWPVLALAQQAAFRTQQGRYSSSMSLALSGLRVAHAGNLVKGIQGNLRQGYQIEGLARVYQAGEAGAPRQLTIVADIFSPAADMPGQRKGRAYFNGQWAMELAAGTQLSPLDELQGRLAGRIRAELPSDPAAGLAAFNGTLDIPMSRLYEGAGSAAFRPVRGSGAMELNPNATGVMSLSLNLWPLFDSSSPNS